jgi:putative transposase
MLVRIRPIHSAAEIARVAKTNSSRWIHEKGISDFAWQTGYGVFSVSESSVAAVSKYIATQEEHHRKHSFQDEFLAFLKKMASLTTRNIFGSSFLSPLRGF